MTGLPDIGRRSPRTSWARPNRGGTESLDLDKPGKRAARYIAKIKSSGVEGWTPLASLVRNSPHANASKTRIAGVPKPHFSRAVRNAHGVQTFVGVR